MEIDDDRVFGLAVVESLLDALEKGASRLGDAGLGFRSGYASPHRLGSSSCSGPAVRAQGGCRARVEPGRQKSPGRRPGVGQAAHIPKPPPLSLEPLGRQLGQRPKTIGRAGENRNGGQPEHVFPTVPAADLSEVVGAHQPDEVGARKAPAQLAEGVGGEARAEPRLEIGDLDARMARQGPGALEAVAKRCHAFDRLQRILRRDQPPDLVEVETLQRLEADMVMAGMGGIEGAAQQADAPGAPVGERGWKREARRQGRTCPSPRTTYLNEVSCSAPTGPRA